MIKDRLRTLLNIRVKRESPVIGAKPKMGSKITLGGMRMFVTSTPPDQLWYFFSLQGWREITFARDRRKYVDLPRASFDLLARWLRGRPPEQPVADRFVRLLDEPLTPRGVTRELAG